MGWSRIKAEALLCLGPTGHEFNDFVAMLDGVPDQDVPLIVEQIQAGRAAPGNQMEATRT